MLAGFSCTNVPTKSFAAKLLGLVNVRIKITVATEAPRLLRREERVRAARKSAGTLETEKQDITGKLNGGSGSPQDFAAWGARLAAIEKELGEKEERWLELAELG